MIPLSGNGLPANRKMGRVLSGIVFINRNGLRWCDAPKGYGPPKTFCNRCKQWGDNGIFARMMEGLACEAAVPKTEMMDATYLKAHRTATSQRRKKGGADEPKSRLIGRTNGGVNTKRHAVTNAAGRPIRFCMTAGQVGDYTGAAALVHCLPSAQGLLAPFHGLQANHERATDRGYDPCGL